jgi:four helix bundle protein
MLKIYQEMLEMLRELRPIMAELERRDLDLARQLRRAAPSVALNTAEGMYSRGKNRVVRYHSALGSAREVLACLEVAEALGYLGGVEARMRARLDRIVGTLVRLVR